MSDKELIEEVNIQHSGFLLDKVAGALQVAEMRLAETDPILGHQLSEMELVFVEIPGMRAKGGRLEVDRQYVLSLTQDELVSELRETLLYRLGGKVFGSLCKKMMRWAHTLAKPIDWMPPRAQNGTNN